MTAKNTSKRLTANTFTPAFLEEIIMETQGLLGFYEIKEYELLQDLILHLDPIQWTEDENGNRQPRADYEVRWFPSKSDPRAGRIKLQPVSERGVNLLDRAHAIPIMERNPWLRRFNAIGFVKNVKRHSEVFRSPKVQDFLLRRHGDAELHNLLDDAAYFKAHIVRHMRDDFSHRQLEAIFTLLERVHEVMQRTPNSMKQKNAEKKGEENSKEQDNTTKENTGNEESTSTDVKDSSESSEPQTTTAEDHESKAESDGEPKPGTSESVANFS